MAEYGTQSDPESNSDRQKENDNALVFSYQTLRNLIGVSGMLLPFILVMATSKEPGDKHIEPSISDYYYTNSGDILVVMLSVLGVFLFTYNGYNWKEKVWTTIAAVCGIGVAFSPTYTKYARKAFSVHIAHSDVPHIFGIERHVILAGIFFIALGIISLCYFPKSDKRPSQRSNSKIKRNVIYQICGVIMLLCVAVLVVFFASTSFKKLFGDFPIILVLEAVAIEAFGISWLTKGETFFPDGEHYLTKGIRELKNSITK